MMRRLRRGGFHFNVVAKARRWFIVSGVLMLISIGSLALREINAGLEFRGGTAFQVRADASSDANVADVRESVERAGLEEATIQEIGDRGFLVQAEHLEPAVQEKVVNDLAEIAGVEASEVNVTDVGPKWGAQITSKAIRALVIFLVFVVIYLSIRLEPKMAGAALVALVHDMILTAGIYSLTGFEVTPATVIALLTILGYSLYDTVVIFDRVKDRTVNLSAAGRVTYADAANDALNQVLVRSINTTVASLLPVGSLLFVGSYLLGAQTLRELALALFIGIGAGAYSSIFIATPILAIWKEREQRWATLRARIGARSGDVTAAVPPPVREPAASVTTPAAPSTPARPSSTRRSGGGRRKRRKHGRR
jgi:preprotein translocase subunit SecF